ncbi:MAG TPA: hypothetical protein DHV89_04295 [Ruminococcus sp.]|nr:hypothetical protein [Ruminococcus sp.]
MIYELCMTDRELSYEGHEERSAQVFSPNGFSEYDVNSHGDGTDVTESICFTSRCDAQKTLKSAVTVSAMNGRFCESISPRMKHIQIYFCICIQGGYSIV